MSISIAGKRCSWVFLDGEIWRSKLEPIWMSTMDLSGNRLSVSLYRACQHSILTFNSNQRLLWISLESKTFFLRFPVHFGWWTSPDSSLSNGSNDGSIPFLDYPANQPIRISVLPFIVPHPTRLFSRRISLLWPVGNNQRIDSLVFKRSSWSPILVNRTWRRWLTSTGVQRMVVVASKADRSPTALVDPIRKIPTSHGYAVSRSSSPVCWTEILDHSYWTGLLTGLHSRVSTIRMFRTLQSTLSPSSTSARADSIWAESLTGMSVAHPWLEQTLDHLRFTFAIDPSELTFLEQEAVSYFGWSLKINLPISKLILVLYPASIIEAMISTAQPWCSVGISLIQIDWESKTYIINTLDKKISIGGNTDVLPLVYFLVHQRRRSSVGNSTDVGKRIWIECDNEIRAWFICIFMRHSQHSFNQESPRTWNFCLLAMFGIDIGPIAKFVGVLSEVSRGKSHYRTAALTKLMSGAKKAEPRRNQECGNFQKMIRQGYPIHFLIDDVATRRLLSAIIGVVQWMHILDAFDVS